MFGSWTCEDAAVRTHLPLTRTQSEDPVAVELVQPDRLVEAALVHTDGSPVT